MLKYSFILALLLTMVSACSSSHDASNDPLVSGPAIAPPVTGVMTGDCATEPAKVRATLSNGVEIAIQCVEKKPLFAVEGTFTDNAFRLITSTNASLPQSERLELMKQELQKVFVKLASKGGARIESNDEIGYFTALLPYSDDLFGEVKKLSFERTILLSPIAYDPDAIREIRAMTPAAEGLVPVAGFTSTKGYSGLEKIGALELVKKAQALIGGDVKVNGSSVNLGITDTGITYNHPTFLAGDRKTNRIAYMKDFTGEGTVYFNLAAKFEVIPSVEGAAADELTVNAEVIETPKLPSKPVGNTLAKVEKLVLKVSPELKAILLAPGSKAKLGYLDEDALQAADEKVDVNGNGKLNDKLYVILVPGDSADKDILYFDKSGTGDFRKSLALGDWNTTKNMVEIFAEKVGFDLKEVKLAAANGTDTVTVRSASIVGYDPGNHGSHVAGISAGNRTILNDSADTLARGVAPEARIFLNRVCANNGGCNATAAFVDLATKAGVDVINMSLGGLSPFNDGFGVQETLINRLTSIKNVLFVISAGNSGPGRQTVGSPSVARLSLSIGASASKGMIRKQYQWPATGGASTEGEEDDFMLFFSSRGPTAAGGFKPNVAAPGTELSSIQLNAAPGSRGGLDVYWGTSMSAPTATGGYALLLDAIRKYNVANASRPLTTDVLVLRQVLIETARPFDVKRFDLSSGQKSDGQYTWIDQGTGMLNLPAAFDKLIALRDEAIPTAIVAEDGSPVNLDYEVLAQNKGPNGIAYDGSIPAQNGVPSFASGLTIGAGDKEVLYPIFIQRNLPEKFAVSEQAGRLTRDLLTSADEFTLRTVIYGSDKTWLKAGVREQLPCFESETSNLTLLGRGFEYTIGDDGKAEAKPFKASTLNVCVSREMIAQLPQGDHGALIYGYRTFGGKISGVPSFVVPIFLTVPHLTLKGSTAYDIARVAKSFTVDRNYVEVPAGTSLVKITLEVDAAKDSNGCAGVELMALMGGNKENPIAERKNARALSCDDKGAPTTADKRIVTVVKTNPIPGIYDLNIFGVYKYAKSPYRLRVDYVTAVASVEKIEGDIKALTGSVGFTLKESSFPVTPDSAKSSVELSGLEVVTETAVADKKHVFVESPLGVLRKYPAGVRGVTITTGGSPGNDIDLIIVECPAAVTNPEDTSCSPVAQSGGSSDVESAQFLPKPDRLYAVRVDGYDIKDEGTFTSGETLALTPEKGTVAITGTAPAFAVGFSFSADQLAKSKILADALFTTGKYAAVGALTIRTAESVVVGAVPIRIKNAPATP